MPEITDEEFEEYRALRAFHERQLKRESAKSVSLEDDIDLPIKKCLMAFALLGCDPQWSCCGFDYDGQPIHKWHQHGKVFFTLRDCAATRDVVAGFLALKRGIWQAETGMDGIPKLELTAELIPPEQWKDKDCPHYHEPAAFNIQFLEDYLMSRFDEFADEAVLHDTNVTYKGMFSNWQYPTKADWVIRKKDVLADVGSAPCGTDPDRASA